ncbi:1,4-alpha-glucan branching protein GlgB [Rubellicoccus peritrichatus]|uniref:1,4-alpha-glucan branching enzyme GlgB n=1 Tax=Rubellicoccus peritrichatus TaxID=3080537 RepID=A0AAQ3LE23_9BACT|nr:1,4-alpha-glucan branching protein GlgB [Puniceicoccus sp. CR14]WOO40354.1 1,4-alpha-glucan branching protein GlgB [Puniceicoccus sp. CR14]
MIIAKKDLELLLSSRHASPHDILGLHPAKVKGKQGMVCRAFLADAKECEIVDVETDERWSLKMLDKTGFFEGFISDRKKPFNYRLRTVRYNGEIRQFWDPYCFLPTISEDDLYLFNQGNLHRAYLKLGAHVQEYDGVRGISFAVWAPSAKRVSVVGDFNQWDGRYHPMREMGASGVWELFIPGVEVGAKYKFEIIGADGYLRLKTDPYGSFFEAPPHNAAVVWDNSGYEWNDSAWLEKRAKSKPLLEPMSIYEVHLGSWKRVVEDGNRPLNYRETAIELVDYCKRLGFNYVEFMPLAEHPFTGSWGYQVTGYFAPTHRYGSPQDFMFLIDHLHQNDIGVIMDWVPAHFPRDTWALAEFDGSHLYEHADPRQGQHQDWGTLIFNYERHEVRSFLINSALAWFDHYHIDGMRVDAVASMLYLDYSREEGEWIPNQYGGRENIGALEFLRQVNDLVHEYYPGALMIAEESTAFGGVTKPTSEYGLGFDFKWNMGWMHDSLEFFEKEPIHRKYHHNSLTFGMLYQYSENFIQVFSHDEVVHGKGSMMLKMGGGWDMKEKAQDLRGLYGFMWAWPGKNCLFMGSEFGQSSEWRYDGSLDWHLLQYQDHEGIQNLICDLNRWYQNNPALGQYDHDPKGFQWINGGDVDNSVLSFIRCGDTPQDTYLVVSNFTPVVRQAYLVGVPYGGYWKEQINTNADCYGGEGSGNGGGLVASNESRDGRPHSLELLLPGLSTFIFKYEG